MSAHKFSWLEDHLRDAKLSIRTNHDKVVADQIIQHAGAEPDDFPLSWDDSEALFERLSQRLKTWTGRTIEEHIRARRSV